MGRNIVCLAVLVSGMILTTSRTYENAAAGKSSSASQSSTDGNYSAALALDGNEDQAFTSCSNTQEENKPWWQVDLGKDYIVFAVRIWNVNHVPGDRVTKCRNTTKGEEYRGTINRTEHGYTCEDWLPGHSYKENLPPGSVNYCRSPDKGHKPWCYCNSSHCPKKEGAYFDYCDIPMCGERLSNFTISLDGHLCHHYTGTVANGASPEIGCDTPVIGRILKIQLFNYTFLTLCEVRIRRFQYQETPTVSVYGSSTPTSISVQWPNGVPIDSTSDIVIKYYVVYQQLPMASQTQQSPAIGKGMMNATISDLQPSTEYSIGLKIKYSFNGRVFNSSQGQMTTFRTDSCENYMITPVLTVEGNAIDTSLKRPNRAFLTTKTQVTGMLPACICNFDIYYMATRDTSFKRTRNTAPSNEIQNLIPFTEYDVIPSVVSPDGKMRNGTSTKITTAEDIPPAPSVIETGVGPTSISVRVIPPNPSYGVITNYSLEMSGYNGESRTIYLGPTDRSFLFDKLKFKTPYTFWARAFSSKGAGDQSEAVTIVTVESIPGPPNTLEVTEQTTCSLVLTWIQPKFQSGKLLDYKVICSPLFSYDENMNRANHSRAFNPAPHVNKLKVSGLTPATEYNCSVAAQTSKGYGPSVWLRNWTKPEDANVPENLFLSIFPDQVTDTTITVQVNKMPKMLKTGSVSKLQIAVEKFGQGRRKRSIPLQSDEHSRYTDHATAKEKGYPGYRTAELAANFSGPFVIGDGNVYGGYYNAPLESGQSYDVIFGMVFEVGELSTVAYRRYGEPIAVKSIDNIESVVWIAVGVAIGFLVILAVIISVVVSVKRKRRNEESRIYEQPIPMNATSQNEDVYDELTTTTTTCHQQNEPVLYENIVDGAKKGPGGNVAVVHQEEYDNPNIDNEDVYENPYL